MFTSLISYVAAAAAFGVAVVVAVRNYRSFTHVVLSVGMALLGLEAVVTGIATLPLLADEAFVWQLNRLLPLSLLPGVWLAFSMVFGRTDYQEIVSKWKWVLVGAVVAPPSLALFFRETLFDSWSGSADSSIVMHLGWPGYVLYLLCLISFVLILMNLERAFRNATGHARWQIKFMLLGIAVIFGARIFTGSQAVLFRSANATLGTLDSASLLLGCMMIGRSLPRAGKLEFDLYLSHSAIYNSFTVLIVGIYFIAVGLVAKLAYLLYGAASLPIIAVVVLVAVLGLSVLFLSDKVRFNSKRFVSRHFKRPYYDYQKVWAGFTENTASLTSMKDLSWAVTTLVSHTLDVLSASLWLADEQQENLILGSSTLLTERQATSTGMCGEAGRNLLVLMADRSTPVDILASHNDPIEQFARSYGEDLRATDIRYCVPLRATGKLVGLITLGERVMDKGLSFEDIELLRTLGDQSAAALLNLKLSERLRETKELEAFRVMSAFFLHDLKNLASKLSLVSQNMPKHYDNEEFRDDAMRTVAQSVDKIKGMCTRLSLLNQTLEIDPREMSVRALVVPTVAGMHGVLGATIKTVLSDNLPMVSVDEEQMRKVIENLLINANEATSNVGCIEISGGYRDGKVELSVSDDGIGIPREFMEKHLFKPFQTTKRQGMGIGLFHCKTIVEAHGGRIEVESTEGKGATFKVILPVKVR